jgi:hypothetical protein
MIARAIKKVVLVLGSAADAVLILALICWFAAYLLKGYVQKALTGKSSGLDVMRGFETIARSGYARRDDSRRDNEESSADGFGDGTVVVYRPE